MSSPVRRELEEFLAGRGTPERVVVAVALAFYRDTHGVQRETLQPLIQVIDRASPGIVQLGSLAGGQGFEIRLAERPFPPEYVAALRRAAEDVLRGADAAQRAEPRPTWVRIEPAPPAPSPVRPAQGVWRRMLAAVRRLLSA